jgi:hypothetical protein
MADVLVPGEGADAATIARYITALEGTPLTYPPNDPTSWFCIRGIILSDQEIAAVLRARTPGTNVPGK